MLSTTLKRRRTALEHMLPANSNGHGMIFDKRIGRYVVNDEVEIHGCIGRLGPDAPHENQSPVVYTVSYAPMTSWRGRREEECVPNTFMPRYNPDLVHWGTRGMLIVRCPEMERMGYRSNGSSPPRCALFVNNLLQGYDYTFGGLVGNPSRIGNGAKERFRISEDSYGTAEFGGGELTTIFNSPVDGRCGQQLYFSEVPLVNRDTKTRQVLGNQLCYDEQFDMDGDNHQQLLLPTVFPLNIKKASQIESTVLFELSERIKELLEPENVQVAANGTKLDNFARDELAKHLNDHGVTYIPPVEHWTRIAVLATGLHYASSQWHGTGGAAGGLKTSYHKATQSLLRQLQSAITQFYDWNRVRARKKFQKGSSSPMCRDYYARLPNALEQLDDDTKADDHKMNMLAKRVMEILDLADREKNTLRGDIDGWLSSHWVGTITSTRCMRGQQVKFIRY